MKRFSLVGALGTSVVFALYAGYLFSTARAPDGHLFSLYQFILAMLLSTWIVVDTIELQRPRPSFDYGWFIFATFPVYVPYYLVSTRRWRGVALSIAVIVLFLLPWLAELSVWSIT
jgi:hypothetical protein